MTLPRSSQVSGQFSFHSKYSSLVISPARYSCWRTKRPVIGRFIARRGIRSFRLFSLPSGFMLIRDEPKQGDTAHAALLQPEQRSQTPKRRKAIVLFKCHHSSVTKYRTTSKHCMPCSRTTGYHVSTGLELWGYPVHQGAVCICAQLTSACTILLNPLKNDILNNKYTKFHMSIIINVAYKY